MAVKPEKREDLLRDAKQFPHRALFHVDWTDRLPVGFAGVRRTADVFVGVRRTDGWSVYFDEDPVLQFNERNELRRLYFQDARYAAATGRLEHLKRQAAGGRVVFERLKLEPECERDVLHVCQDLLAKLATLLELYLSETETQEIVLVGQVPQHTVDWLVDIRTRVVEVASDLKVAAGVN